MQYKKMSNVFELPISVEGVFGNPWDVGYVLVRGPYDAEQSGHAVHAINIHDTLVAENEKLRALLSDVHADLLERAETDSQGGKVVNLGAGNWIALSNAVSESEDSPND